MKRIALLLLVLLVAAAAPAKTLHRLTVENGGQGPYKAEIVEDKDLPGYSIARPADLASAAAVEGPLPVILFGNGGCAREFWGFQNFLTHLASHGYVVITNGKWASAQPQRPPQPAQQGAFDREAMMAQF
ncbi:MAG: hypothetical protein IJ255_00285, partial [Bacteroidales bacterium]|nr:hypothetical protein [Bacteroidales bacterium]